MSKGYNDVLPYFKKSEHNMCNGRYARPDHNHHGYEGPLIVSDPGMCVASTPTPKCQTDLFWLGRGTPQVYSERFVIAAQQAGIKLNDGTPNTFVRPFNFESAMLMPARGAMVGWTDYNGNHQGGVAWAQLTTDQVTASHSLNCSRMAV
jgi:choline dehydrogenase-like flavoprotein